MSKKLLDIQPPASSYCLLISDYWLPDSSSERRVSSSLTRNRPIRFLTKKELKISGDLFMMARLFKVEFRAGVAQWSSASLPSWSCEFDSHHPLHFLSRLPGGQYLIRTSQPEVLDVVEIGLADNVLREEKEF